jgi:hypothetical protein
MAYRVNIVVHQLEQARWEVVNFRDANARAIQLSYHTGDHYASVRAADGSLPPRQTTRYAVPGGSDGTFAADALAAAYAEHKQGFDDDDNYGVEGDALTPSWQEQMVMDSCGATLIEARNALLDNFSDPDAAVNYLLMLKFSLQVCLFVFGVYLRRKLIYSLLNTYV